jgi:hypothetical protein
MSAVAVRTQRADPDAILKLFGKSENGGKLLRGRTLTCPACEREDDVLRYVPLEHSVKYADQVIPPLKCRMCKHVFALRP